MTSYETYVLYSRDFPFYLKQEQMHKKLSLKGRVAMRPKSIPKKKSEHYLCFITQLKKETIKNGYMKEQSIWCMCLNIATVGVLWLQR